MPSAADHLAYLARHLGGDAALAKFADRLSLADHDGEIVMSFAGRNLSIRATSQGLVVAGEDIALADDPQQTLGRVTKRLVQRLAQIDGGAI